MAIINKFLVCCCVLLIAVMSCSYAQLTFSSNWGKRSESASSGGLNGSPAGQRDAQHNPSADQCRPTTDSLVLIYHFIQAEAQKYLECQQRNEQNHF